MKWNPFWISFLTVRVFGWIYKLLKTRDDVKILSHTFALLKALKVNLFYSKKANGNAFKSAEVQKSAEEISHGLDIRLPIEDVWVNNIF